MRVEPTEVRDYVAGIDEGLEALFATDWLRCRLMMQSWGHVSKSLKLLNSILSLDPAEQPP